MDKYAMRGVSSKKEDVHNALKDNVDKGLFPGAFCKIIPDYLGNDPDYCNVMHSDGAGTKSSLAYIYYKETGEADVFKGIVQDAIVMNVDDVLCVGATGNFLLSNTIGRNPKHIPGEVVKTLIHAFQDLADWYSDLGIQMILTGGETADVGDLVRTVIVDSTVTVRMKRNEVINNDMILPGMVIVGLASSGQTTYEDVYNSGISSNGLTSARHDIFHKEYRQKYPASYNPDIDENLVYSGPYALTDTHESLPYNIGRAVLSPTRTYAPVIKSILKECRSEIGGMIHCTGGAQTKCLHFGKQVHYIKNNLFEMPPIFKLIKEASGTSFEEMYRVFNMGHRLEIYVNPDLADTIIEIAKSYKIDAQIVGEVKSAADANKLTIHSPEGIIEY